MPLTCIREYSVRISYDGRLSWPLYDEEEKLLPDYIFQKQRKVNYNTVLVLETFRTISKSKRKTDYNITRGIFSYKIYQEQKKKEILTPGEIFPIKYFQKTKSLEY
jgi:hypothetical protein